MPCCISRTRLGVAPVNVKTFIKAIVLMIPFSGEPVAVGVVPGVRKSRIKPDGCDVTRGAAE